MKIVDFIKITMPLIVVLGGLFLGMRYLTTKKTNYDREIDSLINVNLKLSHQIDSLKIVNIDLEKESEKYIEDIKKKEKQISKLNKEKNEEINRIKHLPIDSAILFLSNKLSQKP